MRVFVTGATGFIGSALVPELVRAGHHVVGLARTDAGAHSIATAGALAHRGDLQDLESLHDAAANADAVIHTAFIHDFSKFAENSQIDAQAIEVLGAALKGSNRPLIVTSGLAIQASGGLATENDPPVPVSASLPRASEAAASSLAQRGVNTIVVRLPQVHDTVKQGLITYLINHAREKRTSAYVGDGMNRWAAVHRLDAAHLYRLALEKGTAGARFHAIAEEGVPLRQIAEAIGRGLKVPVISVKPEKVTEHFGWLTHFAQIDLAASSAQTRQKLGWSPAGPTLLTDLTDMRYAK